MPSMLSSVSLTNLAEPEPEPEETGSPSSTRGLAYSLPLRCVSVDSDGKTLRASGSLDGTASVGVLPIRSERQAEFFRRKLDSVSSLPRLSTPLIEPDEPDATQFRMDDETGYAEIPWRELPARVPSDATLSRVYRRTRAQERVEAEVTTGLPPLQPQVSVSHSEAEAKVELAKGKGRARRRRRRDEAQAKSQAGGSITAQLDEFRAVFAAFDANGDGGISTTELGAVMKAIGRPDCGQEELLQIARELDTDNSGSIGFAEFLSLIQKTVGGGEGALSDGDEASLWLAKLENTADMEARSQARKRALEKQMEERRGHLRTIEHQIK